MRNAEVFGSGPARTPQWWRTVLVCALLAWGGVAVGTAAVRYQPFEAGLNLVTPSGAPVQVAVESPIGGDLDVGYFAVRVQIRNDTGSELTWNAQLTSGRGYGFDRGESPIRRAQFETQSEDLRVPAGTAREFQVCLPVPGSPPGEFMITGPFVDERVFPVAHYNRSGAAALTTPAARSFIHELRRRSAYGHATTWNEVRRERLPTDWRVLSSTSALVVTADDWAQIDPAQREAIRGYVARGGHLDWAGPAAHWEFAAPAELGGGKLSARDEPRPYGLGWISAGWFRSERSGGKGWQGVFEFRERADFPPIQVPDPLDRGLPRWTLFGVLGITAVLSGPISLFWLARQGMRHRLLVLLPAIALGATLILVAVVTLRDGFGGRGQRTVLLAAVEGRPELAVFQYQTARCGLLIDAGFSLPDDVMMHAGSHPQTALDLKLRRDGRALAGDWFRNRTTTFHSLTTLVPSRAEVRLLPPARAGSAVRVISTFAAPLRDLYLSRGSTLWHAAQVLPGTETTLEALPPRSVVPRLRALGSSPNSHLQRLVGEFAQHDRFLAQVEGLEGVPLPTLERIEWEDEIFVTGSVVTAEGGAR